MNNNARKQKKAGKGLKSSASVAFATLQKTQAPSMTSVDRNSRRIVHRELIGTVNGSIAFTVNKYSLNPGLVRTFPWLSTQAAGWEQYRFNKLEFQFVTRTATSTVGSVIMAPDYDPLDPNPTSEAYASSYMDATENATWVDQVCRLSTKAMFPLGPRKYIRSSNIAGDLRTFDCGNFFLCTVEEVGADAIGKLWVEYDVELSVPQLVPSAAVATRLSYYQNTGGAQALVTTVTEAVEADTVVVDALGIGTPVTGVFTPPAGTYLVTCAVCIADSAAEVMTSDLYFYKNGVIVPALVSRQYMTMPAGGVIQQHLMTYVSCNGTDTINFAVNVTGAAGALTLRDDSTAITFQLV